MKVILTIWISVVLIQEVVPSALIRHPRHSPAPKASIHTEYEAKYAQKGKHGNESFSLVKGNQEFHHDHCGENWNEFAEKCATLIKELIGSLANVVSSKPGDATNLQLHIKNSFKHFDSSHNCSCVNCAGKDLSNLDLSSLFNNITIETSPENAALACKDLSDAIQSNKLANVASPSNINPLKTGINPEDEEGCGDETNNSRRQTGVLDPLTSVNSNAGVPGVDNAQGKNHPVFPLNTETSELPTKSESFPSASTSMVPQPEKTVFGPYTYPPPPSASHTTPIKLLEDEPKPVILSTSGEDTPLFAPEIADGTNNYAPEKFLQQKVSEPFPGMKSNIENPTPSQVENFKPLPGDDPSAQSTASDDCETDTKNEAPGGALNPPQVLPDHLGQTKPSGPELNDAALPFVFPPFLKPPKTYSKEEEDLDKLIGPESIPKHSISEHEQSPIPVSPGNSNSGLNIPKIPDHGTGSTSLNPLISGEPQIFSPPHGLPGSVLQTEPGFIEKIPGKESSNSDDCDDNTESTLDTPEQLPDLIGIPKHQGTTSQPTLPPPESQLNNHLPLSSSSGKKPSQEELPNYPAVNVPINQGKPTMSPPFIGGPEFPREVSHIEKPSLTLKPPITGSTIIPEDDSNCEDSEPSVIPPHAGQEVIPGAIPPSKGHSPTIMPPHIGQINIPGAIPPSQGHGSTIMPPHTSQMNIPGIIPPSQGHGSTIMPPHTGQMNIPGIIPPSQGHASTIMPPHTGQMNIPGIIPPSQGHVPTIMPPHTGQTNIPGTIPPSQGHASTIMPPHTGQMNIPGTIPPSQGHASTIMPPHTGQMNIPGIIPPSQGHVPTIMPPHTGQTNIPGTIPPSQWHGSTIIPPHDSQVGIPGTIPPSQGHTPTIMPPHTGQINIPGATGGTPASQGPVTVIPPHLGQTNLPGIIPPSDGSKSPTSGEHAPNAIPAQVDKPNFPGAISPPIGQPPTIPSHMGQANIPGVILPPEGSASPILPPHGGQLNNHEAVPPSKEPSHTMPLQPSSPAGGTLPTTISTPFSEVLPVVKPGKLGQPGFESIHNAQDPAVLASEPDCDESPDSTKVVDFVTLKPKSIPQGAHTFNPEEITGGPDLIVPPVVPGESQIIDPHAPEMQITHPEPNSEMLNPFGLKPSGLPATNTHSSDKNDDDCDDNTKDQHLSPMVVPSETPYGVNTPALTPTKHDFTSSPGSLNDLAGGANAHYPNIPIGSPLNHNSGINLPPTGGLKDDNKEDCSDDTSSKPGSGAAPPKLLGPIEHKNPQSHDFVQVPLPPGDSGVSIPANPESSHVMQIGKPNNSNNILSPISGKPSEPMNDSPKTHSEGHSMTPGATKGTEPSLPPLFSPEGIHPVFGPVNQRPIKVPGSTSQHKPLEIVTPAPTDSSDQLVRPTANPALGSNVPLSPSQMPDATLPGAVSGANPINQAISGKPNNHLMESLGPHASPVPSDSYPTIVSGTEPPFPSKIPLSNNPATETTYPNYEETSMKPTTFQTTSVEPTPPLVDSHLPPPLLTIPYHQTSPHTPYSKNSARPSSSPTIFPTEKDPLEDDDDDEEDCCSCEACEEGENKSPKEYRVAVCQDLEEARRELKAIFDKIRKKLKCGRKTIKTFGPI